MPKSYTAKQIARACDMYRIGMHVEKIKELTGVKISAQYYHYNDRGIVRTRQEGNRNTMRHRRRIKRCKQAAHLKHDQDLDTNQIARRMDVCADTVRAYLRSYRRSEFQADLYGSRSVSS